ncbi:hypothetical protein [Methylocystis sp. ATCC 49242]|uniref:hypothetical protein n=1 Tax=Methylocystis sp. ATCC 49242 TaxID=622637 RepID=UPI0001F86C76|nr:hypothetical protein [Methylocystis sp. ATCC 49242]
MTNATTRRRAGVSGVIALAWSLASASGAAAFEGRYAGGVKSKATKEYSRSLDIKRRANGDFRVEAVVGTPDCTGVFDGVGAAGGDALAASQKEDNETCTLTIRRTKKGVSVEEDSRCLYFHGASCEFSGDYRKK